MTDVAAIILAAGQSRRMGDLNKLLLPVSGMPMIRHVALQYRAAIAGPIVVVTGHDAARIVSALEDIDVAFAFNPDHETGQQTSVACGLRACPSAELVLIGLGDQPLLNAGDISSLLRAHVAGDPAKISIPIKGDKRGNPIVIPKALRPRLLEDPDRPGCMRFTRENPDLVQQHALKAHGFYTDVDTADAYQALLARKETAQ